MRWLLDTNVVSESVRTRPNQKVMRWIEQQPLDLVAISIVTAAELRVGTISVDSEIRQRRYGEWLQHDLAPLLDERTLPLTSEILIDWLQIARVLGKKGIARQAPDLLIAATARIHNLTVVTRNARDFSDTGIVVYNPWTGDTHQMDHP